MLGQRTEMHVKACEMTGSSTDAAPKCKSAVPGIETCRWSCTRCCSGLAGKGAGPRRRPWARCAAAGCRNSPACSSRTRLQRRRKHLWSSSGRYVPVHMERRQGHQRWDVSNGNRGTAAVQMQAAESLGRMRTPEHGRRQHYANQADQEASDGACINKSRPSARAHARRA
jgi:hypothetical protein